MAKIAINGFGRIGRLFFRDAIGNPNLEIVAINDLGDLENLAYLLKYDTVYGRYDKEIKMEDGNLVVDGKAVKCFQEKDPAKLPWKDLNIDVVIESTGRFTDAEGTIFISDNQAHYALGNYDLPLLQNIKSGLDKFAIKTPKITCHKRKGLIGSFGYKYNHDYWTLSVNRKVDLMKLFSYIGPRLKHKNRLKQMKIAVENIEERNRLYGQK